MSTRANKHSYSDDFDDDDEEDGKIDDDDDDGRYNIMLILNILIQFQF